MNYVAKQVQDKSFVIITDVRQENEVKWLMDNGFKIIKVSTPEEVRIQRMVASGDTIPEDRESLEKMLNHETEQFVDQSPCDYHVENIGTIEDLERKAEWIYQDIQWGYIIKDRGTGTNGNN